MVGKKRLDIMKFIHYSWKNVTLYFRLLSRFTIAIIAASIFFNTGCATLSKEECLMANWYDIGYEDGAKGYPTSRIAKHRKACVKHGVHSDLQTYLDGHASGLVVYCTPQNGYQLGLRGGALNTLCQGPSSDGFVRAYYDGQEIYQFKLMISQQQKRADQIKNKLDRVEKKIEEKEEELNQNCSEKKNCKKILNEIRDLDYEKDDLIYRLELKKLDIADMEQSLIEMKSRIQY